MTKPKWLLPAAFTAAAVIIAIVAVLAFRNGGEALAAEDIEKKLKDMYGAEVTDIRDDGNVYRVTLERRDGEFLAVVDSDGGAVISLEKTASPELIPEKEIKEKLTERYSAEPTGLALKDGMYYAKVEKDTHFTDVQVDALTGEIKEKVTEKTPAGQEETPEDRTVAGKPAANNGTGAGQGENNNGNRNTAGRGDNQDSPPPARTVRITENEAAAIALKEVSGELDDVDYEESDDGGYYIVEIEAGDMDAEVQIHAITRKVMSVVWDD
ncbi:PepSY domain-containing protein [Edaphobacillus lindanitolerans]|uniref:Peptidase propeptide and YPEB domain-containing protein n=1 Tax=Edaphobacillus lindanitolerans TaxID=550447 RepID=A0A1U7PLB1_9BACI|nr:PepSY domain-containing protein [Edaphobacillus lindanitolerans]SIT74644.1 Peptidase propeptide and YPEB domain-containing protein [Edaphobacillus lindanitolerans]